MTLLPRSVPSWPSGDVGLHGRRRGGPEGRERALLEIARRAAVLADHALGGAGRDDGQVAAAVGAGEGRRRHLGGLGGLPAVELELGHVDLPTEVDVRRDRAPVAVVDGAERALRAREIDVRRRQAGHGHVGHLALGRHDAALAHLGHGEATERAEREGLPGSQRRDGRDVLARDGRLGGRVPAPLRVGEPAPAAARGEREEDLLPGGAGRAGAVELHAAVDDEGLVAPAPGGAVAERRGDVGEVGDLAHRHEVAVAARDHEATALADDRRRAGELEGDGRATVGARRLAVERRAHGRGY
jgi:hypothetical protein